MKKIKNWNWGAFVFAVIIVLLGTLSNKNIPTIFDCLMFTLIFGIPFGIVVAYISREETN